MLNCSQDVSLFSVHPISFTYKESEISSVEKIDSKSGSFNVDIMCDVLCKNCTAFYDVKTTLDSSFLLRKGLSEVLPIKKDSEDIAGRASKTITLNSTYYGYRDKVLENKEVVLFD